MTVGKGAVISSSLKQKINTRSSTEAELVASDDALSSILWSKNFLKAQGYRPKVILNQDNQSTMKLQQNGKASSHKRTKHIDIRYFTIKDYLDRQELGVEYCPTESMQADYLSKPLQGKQFEYQRRLIMGLS